MNRFFKKLKVVELASVLAGPATGLFFAELGAKVLKIENKKTNGDVTRGWKLPSEDPCQKTSAYFNSVNFKKKYLFLDLTNQKDRSICLQKIKRADIVIVNYKKGDDKKLGLDYATLKKVNPQLIYGRISGFGVNDDRSAFDLIIQAESGFMSMNGTQKSGPLKMPVALIDVLAAHQLKEAILLALIKRLKTKKGSCVTVSLFDVAICSLVNQATNWLMVGHLPELTGSLHPNIAPYGEIFTTKDNHLITFAIGTDEQFKNLCVELGLEKVSENPKYVTNQLRVKYRKSLFKILFSKMKNHSLDSIENFSSEKRIPLGKVRNLREVFELKEAQKLIHKTNSGEFKYLSSIAFSTSS